MPGDTKAWGLQIFCVDDSIFMSGCLFIIQPCRKSVFSVQLQQGTGSRGQGQKLRPYNSDQAAFPGNPQQEACSCNQDRPKKCEEAGAGTAGGR